MSADTQSGRVQGNAPVVIVPGRYKGRVALVTGAAAGIGATTARRLAAEGAALALVDKDKDALEQVASSCSGVVTTHVADVSNAEETARSFESIIAKHGRVDIAVLNAGVECRRAPIHETSIEDFDRVMAINVRGVFLWLARCMADMRQRERGAIIITSSTSGLRATPEMGPYTTSKHAVVGLMKSAALEGARFGVRVNCLNPGPTETRMMDAINEDWGELRDVRARSEAKIPLGRYGAPEEMAALIAFLCSDEAAFCTGATYLADGGILAG